MKIVFVTNNKNKLSEIQEILGDRFEIVSLRDINCDVDIPETADTLEGNAQQKAQYVWEHYHLNCFADDTGLEVATLDGAPGVRSARYDDTTDHDSEANMRKLLRELGENNNRNARFRTVIALILNGEVTEFEGIVNGHIAREKHGRFVPEGYDKSFAELGMKIKNHISHRARAVAKLAEYLKNKL